MSRSARRYDPWRDVGAPIGQQCRVEQVAVAKEHGAVTSRSRKQGQVLGRGTRRIKVQFDGESKAVSVRPHMVRVLSDRPVTWYMQSTTTPTVACSPAFDR